MNVKIHDLMVKTPISTRPHKSVGHVRDIMRKNKIHSVPVTDGEKQIEGIVSLTDLLEDHKEGTPVSAVMSKKVLSVPLYADVSVAARIMRNHHIHHLVVTDEKKIVGVLSSFDLLQLVEDHRYKMKNPSTPSKKVNKRH